MQLFENQRSWEFFREFFDMQLLQNQRTWEFLREFFDMQFFREFSWDYTLNPKCIKLSSKAVFNERAHKISDLVASFQ